MPIANPNYFTGNPLERLSEKRGDALWFAEQLAHEKACMVPFWRGRPLVEMPDGPEGQARALWLSPLARSEFVHDAPVVLLGFRDGAPYFALDASASGASAETAPFADMASYKGMRELAGMLSREEVAILGQALWLLDWHRRHQFCANCGAKSQMVGGGTHRRCDGCDTDHFPRTDPVAIVLVSRGEDCLLGRGVKFPPTFFSALAGFLEPGETLEECAAREVFEEVGVKVNDVRYIFSQPWPFPSSLMAGYIAETEDTTFTLDETEIAEARWVSKDEIRALLNGERRDDLNIPPPFAIAHQLLVEWVRDEDHV